MSEAVLTLSTTDLSFSTMFFMDWSSCPVSSESVIWSLAVRLPSDKSFATRTASPRASLILREMKKAMQSMMTAHPRVPRINCHWILEVWAWTSST